jgi:hypothetical protein
MPEYETVYEYSAAPMTASTTGAVAEGDIVWANAAADSDTHIAAAMAADFLLMSVSFHRSAPEPVRQVQAQGKYHPYGE